jgi:hypothetical protein
MKQETKSCFVAALECFDYEIRVPALRLIGSGADMSAALDDTVADPELLRDVLECLANLSYAGLKEYYGQWDDESVHWTISREHALAEDLSTIEAQLLQTHEGTPVKTDEMKRELAQRETEIRAALEAGTPPPQPRRPKLPPGTRPDATTARALAIWRRREMEED